MKKLAVIATSLLISAPVLAQSVGEKSGVNSALGISPTTADFVKEAAIGDMLHHERLEFHGSNRQGGGERSIYTRQLSPENAGQAKESEWLRLQQAI